MSSLNKVTLIGNLGRDPEVRRMTDGSPVISFSMAMSETWRDKATGEKKERTEWANIVIFNEHIAKTAEQYLRKGSKAYVEGEFRTRKWTDKEGHDRWSTEVVVSKFNGSLLLLGDPTGRPAPSPDDYGTTRDKPATGGAAGGMARYQETGAGIPQEPSGYHGGHDPNDDIPF